MLGRLQLGSVPVIVATWWNLLGVGVGCGVVAVSWSDRRLLVVVVME